MAISGSSGSIFNQHRDQIKEIVLEQFNAPSFTIPNLGELGNRIPGLSDALDSYYCSTREWDGKKGTVPWEMRVHQAMADLGLFYGYNKTTGSFDLFTANKPILQGLDALDRFTDAKTYERNLSGVINAMRIDVTYTDLQGNYTAKATRTAGKTEIALANYIVIPYIVIQRIVFTLKALLRRRSVLRIVSEFESGAFKERLVSMKPRTLTRASGGDRDADFVDFSLAGRLYVPVLNAPLTTMGLTALRFDALDRIEVLNARDVKVEEPDNTIEAVIQNEILAIFVSQVFNQGETSEAKRRLFRLLEQYNQRPVPSNASRIDVTTLVRDLPTEQKNHLWRLLSKSMREYSGRIYSIMNTYTPVDVPSSTDELRAMLKEGVYRIVSLSSTGKFNMMYATNNLEYLHIAYGDNYIKNYESKGFRIGHLRRMLDDGIDQKTALDNSGVRSLYSEDLSDWEIIDSALKSENTTSSNANSDTVNVRTLFFMKEEGRSNTIYRSLKLSKIYSMARLDA